MENIFGNETDIMDVTLRDGSYLIDFQFTIEDTVFICKALENAGINWIEVGHGLGLNASNKGHGRAAATDEEYLDVVHQNISQAKWGMFFIPGIGTKEDIRLAAKYQMSFIRIGTNVTEIEKAQPYIELAKELGMIVSYNAMKSYAVSPETFAKSASTVAKWGTDIVYLVDSAGGLFPDEVEEYFNTIKQETSVALGFHGHDNLAMAMANSLKAVDANVALVDSSLQGMGRSAGNAITEILVGVMKQKGLLNNIDFKEILDLGEGLIQPLMQRRGLDSMGITSGYARFHSSFTSKVKKYSEKFNVDVRDVIVRLCEEDQISAPDDLLERIGFELAGEKASQAKTIAVQYQSDQSTQQSIEEALVFLLKELRIKASKYGKFSTINVVIDDTENATIQVSKNIHSSVAHVVGSVTVSNHQDLQKVLEIAEKNVNIVLLDIDAKHDLGYETAKIAQKILKDTLFFSYSDSDLWVDAIKEQVLRLADETLNDKIICVFGIHNKSEMLANSLSKMGAKIYLFDDLPQKDSENLSGNIKRIGWQTEAVASVLKQANQLIFWKEATFFQEEHVNCLSDSVKLIDAQIGAIPEVLIQQILTKSLFLTRVNIWPCISSTLQMQYEFYKIQNFHFGRKQISSIPIVSGGAIGNEGDIVVDSIQSPSNIVGIANGKGGLKKIYSDDDLKNISLLKNEIYNRLINLKKGNV